MRLDVAGVLNLPMLLDKCNLTGECEMTISYRQRRKLSFARLLNTSVTYTTDPRDATNTGEC